MRNKLLYPKISIDSNQLVVGFDCIKGVRLYEEERNMYVKILGRRCIRVLKSTVKSKAAEHQILPRLLRIVLSFGRLPNRIVEPALIVTSALLDWCRTYFFRLFFVVARSESLERRKMRACSKHFR